MILNLTRLSELLFICVMGFECIENRRQSELSAAALAANASEDAAAKAKVSVRAKVRAKPVKSKAKSGRRGKGLLGRRVL